jgi:hypothetical protein
MGREGGQRSEVAEEGWEVISAGRGGIRTRREGPQQGNEGISRRSPRFSTTTRGTGHERRPHIPTPFVLARSRGMDKTQREFHTLRHLFSFFLQPPRALVPQER